MEALVHTLLSAGVNFVVIGSVAAKLWGVDLDPGDLDVVPDVEAANLTRLVSALKALEASIAETNQVGSWTKSEDEEWHWTSRAATDSERQKLLACALDAHDVSSLDHQFFTKHGTWTSCLGSPASIRGSRHAPPRWKWLGGPSWSRTSTISFQR